ncbi:MAG: phenylalanine--tRNA ligase subunit beta [Flavobacteriales bacterium]
MKVSYNWLKKYIQTDLSPEEMGKILTDTGLEVESIEKIEAIQGGLQGVVIGHVLTCEKHPDADKLNVTTVNIGTEELQIVCGAPNVAAGQKVVVATVGTTLYPQPDEAFQIKKAKIRGVESAGMLCAEDELGIGQSHAGILVLPEHTEIGMPASAYFDLSDDFQIEIGLTPNRADAMGHIGVARDLKAALNFHQKTNLSIQWPKVEDISATGNLPIQVKIEDQENCLRYCGVSMENVQVAPSPEWLQKALRSVGLNPINNLVDISNYVMRELGTPLHIFDAKALNGTIVVRQSKANEKIETLDQVQRTLLGNELMICNQEEALCIAGVLGGLHSGVNNETTTIFIESALFDAVSVRKTARQHGLNTDASFRFERGVDPALTIYALQRCVQLIQEIAGGKVAMETFDWKGNVPQNKQLNISLSKVNQLIGCEIDKSSVVSILSDLDIQVLSENGDEITIEIPAYRVDVTRESDVIEEILRIFGFNSVPIPEKWNLSLPISPKINKDNLQRHISELLVGKGFSEVMNNSLTKSSYVSQLGMGQIHEEHAVRMLNPLSQDLDVMRQTLLFGLLENIERNQNRQSPNLRLFEFGKTYAKYPSGYSESQQLIVCMTGQQHTDNWLTPEKGKETHVSYYDLKGVVMGLLERLGFTGQIQEKELKNQLFSDGQSFEVHKKTIAECGWATSEHLQSFGIKQPVFYAIVQWEQIMELLNRVKIEFSELPKSFATRRDFSLLIDRTVSFGDLRQAALQADRKLLKSVGLFDVYEGKNLAEGKKSYALSFILQDGDRTLTDQEIDSCMSKIQANLEKECGALLRN